MILSPSLLSADFSRLGEEMDSLYDAGLLWAHFDVMDGLFVPNITFVAPIIKALRSRSELFLDLLVLIEQPEIYL